ncbi:MAG: hypothetical protein IPK94_21020 [Saprospiraceae bacterium]|nr:hypothetical protein [Saprospiraceae bacterium]
MIDGIKATTIIPDIIEWKRSTCIDLMTSVNVDSGEQVRSRSRKYDDGSESYKYWANYDYYNLEVIESIKDGKLIYRLNLRGSLHKAAMFGSNAKRLTWSLLQSELTNIEADLKISLFDWKIKNIEYGVNLVRDQPVLPFLSQSLLMHRRQQFGTLNSEKGEAIGFQSMGCQHQLKAYDKALQLKLPNPLMRIEDRVNRMQYLRGHRYMTLANLQEKSSAYSLKHNLLSTWDDALMIDPIIVQKAQGKHQARLKEYSNPRFWMMAAALPDRQKKFRYHKEVLKDLQLKYDDCVHKEITEQINTEWEQCYN